MISGIPLEKMDALFSRPTHKTVWAQITRKPLPELEDLSSPRNSIDKEGATVQDVEKA